MVVQNAIENNEKYMQAKERQRVAKTNCPNVAEHLLLFYHSFVFFSFIFGC